jgi:hypothetical protein
VDFAVPTHMRTAKSTLGPSFEPSPM